MSDSKRDDLLGSILRRIPGFRGYGQREDQKASEEQTRRFVNERLQQAKALLDQLGRQLADKGDLDGIVPLEQLRDRLENVRSLVDRPVLGSSGLIGKAVEADRLEDLYDLEVSIMDHAESLSDLTEQLTGDEHADKLLEQLGQKVDELSRLAEQRQRSLKSLAD